MLNIAPNIDNSWFEHTDENSIQSGTHSATNPDHLPGNIRGQI